MMNPHHRLSSTGVMTRRAAWARVGSIAWDRLRIQDFRLVWPDSRYELLKGLLLLPVSDWMKEPVKKKHLEQDWQKQKEKHWPKVLLSG